MDGLVTRPLWELPAAAQALTEGGYPVSESNSRLFPSLDVLSSVRHVPSPQLDICF